jgi:hypothetical protein
MNVSFRPVLVLLGLAMVLVGCTTIPKADWDQRVGVLTYDDAVLELGPPDKSAKLSDDTVVAEWLVRRGGYQVHGYGYGYYGHPYRPYRYPSGFYPGGSDYVTKSPDRNLRLTFDPGGTLKNWKEFYE